MRRLVLGVSQAKVAEAVDVSFQQVQKYENGTNRISASRLQLIADFLDVTPAYFFEGSSSRWESGCDSAQDKPRSQFADILFTRESLQLNLAFAAVRDAKVRKTILDLVTALAGDTINSV